MAAGDITGLIESYPYSGSIIGTCVYKYSDNICIVGGNPYISTVGIQSDGKQITGISNITTIQYVKHHKGFVHVNGDVYACVYYRDGYGISAGVATFRVSDTGVLELIAIGDFGISGGVDVDLCHLHDNLYVMSHSSGGYYDRLQTVNISNEGAITYLHSYARDRYGSYASLIKISDNIVCTLYSKWDGIRTGIITTGINSDGTFAGNIHNVSIAPTEATSLDILNVCDNTYVSLLGGMSADYVITNNISPTGIISSIQTHAPTPSGSWRSLARIGDTNAFVISYGIGGGTAVRLWMCTVDIQNNGTIDDINPPQQIVFNSNGGRHPSMAHMQGNVYMSESYGYSGTHLHTVGIDSRSGAITARPPRFTTGLSHRSFH